MVAVLQPFIHILKGSNLSANTLCCRGCNSLAFPQPSSRQTFGIKPLSFRLTPADKKGPIFCRTKQTSCYSNPNQSHLHLVFIATVGELSDHNFPRICSGGRLFNKKVITVRCHRLRVIDSVLTWLAWLALHGNRLSARLTENSQLSFLPRTTAVSVLTQPPTVSHRWQLCKTQANFLSAPSYFSNIWLLRLIEWIGKKAVCWFNVLSAIWAVSTSVSLSVKEDAYAQLWEMDVIWLWALILALEAKMADHLHRSSSEVEASTQAARSKLWDTVTDRCSVLRCSSRSIAESHHLPATSATNGAVIWGRCSSWLELNVTSWLSLARDSQANRLAPTQLLLSLSRRILVSAVLFIDHYPWPSV